MSSNVTKRTLSAGLGVGALALLAPRASADTPFSSFAFPATGAPTARTLPDRLGELKNVKDFGARGDGSTNDTAAIQTAVSQQGTIYFPPGTYRITRSINLRGDGQYQLIGTRHTYVQGLFDGYLFDTSTNWVGDVQFNFYMSSFGLINDNRTPNAGCVRVTGGILTTIEKCEMTAWRGVTFHGEAGTSIVRDCFFRPRIGGEDMSENGITEKISTGIQMDTTGGGTIANCDFNGFYNGIQCAGLIHIIDTRVEMCYRGVVAGINSEGGELPTYLTFQCGELEANGYHIILQNVWFVRISNVSMQGDVFSVPENPKTQVNDKPGQCGILINQCQNAVFESTACIGAFQQGCYVFTQGPGGGVPPVTESIFMAVHADLNNSDFPGQFPNAKGWQGMQFLDRSRVTFIQCNNP
jgi:Pectate lyase superfamily protein